MSERGREGEEAEEEGFGEFDVNDPVRWSMMQVQPGVIAVAPVNLEGKELVVLLFITKRWVENDGSVVAEFTSLGTRDPQESRKVTQVSKTLNLIHFCNSSHCAVPGNFLSHVQQVALIRGEKMQRKSLGHSGLRRWIQLCWEHLGCDVSAPPEVAEESGSGERSSRRERKGALRRPAAGGVAGGEDGEGPQLVDIAETPEDPPPLATRGERRVTFAEDAQPNAGRGAEVAEGGASKKRQRHEAEREGRRQSSRPAIGVGDALAELRRDLAEQSRRDLAEEEASGSKPMSRARKSSSAAAKDGRKKPGPLTIAMPEPSTAAASLLSGKSEERRGSSLSGKRPRSPKEELVAAAATASGDGAPVHGAKKEKKRRRGRDSRIVQALKEAIAGKKKKKKKKKKKDKSSREGDGSPPDSGGGSDDSEDSDSEDSDSEDSSGSSEERLSRKFKAPLKRKAEKKPGSVAELLLTQIAQQLQELHVEKDQLLTVGPDIILAGHPSSATRSIPPGNEGALPPRERHRSNQVRASSHRPRLFGRPLYGGGISHFRGLDDGQIPGSVHARRGAGGASGTSITSPKARAVDCPSARRRRKRKRTRRRSAVGTIRRRRSPLALAEGRQGEERRKREEQEGGQGWQEGQGRKRPREGRRRGGQMRPKRRRLQDNSKEGCMGTEAEAASGKSRGEDRGLREEEISEAADTRSTEAAELEGALSRIQPSSHEDGEERTTVGHLEEPFGGLRTAVEALDDGIRGEKVADRLCETTSLGMLGLGLAWIAFEGVRTGQCKAWLWQHLDRFLKNNLREQLGKGGRSLFPFPNVWGRLEQKLHGSRFDDIFFESFWTPEDYTDAWVFLSTKFCQQLHGGDLGFRVGPLRKVQRLCLECTRRRVEVMLKDDHCHPIWGVREIKEELANKDIGYAGEEIGKLEKLSLEQITPSLPPPDRGGSIRLEDWLSDSTRELLRHPERLRLEDHGQTLPNLKGRVHVVEGERLSVAQILVARNVCIWRRSSEALTYRGQPVRNGLFGVRKPGKTVNEKPILRVIMNLIPTNSLFQVIAGSVHRLPSITQWGALFVGEGETVEVSQADISSAFYLFQLPSIWQCILPFNIEVTGAELGPTYVQDETYVLCAKVLPMGWHSAVGLMEEAAERLLSTAD